MLNLQIDRNYDEVMGKGLHGKLNESLILIMLVDNMDRLGLNASDNPQGMGITTADIALELNKPQSTIATAVKRLVKKKLVEHSKGQAVRLTEKGQAHANTILRQHRLLGVLFSKFTDTDSAHNEALALMLVSSEDLIEKIDEEFNCPKECPCGMRIPSKSECLK